MPVGNCLRPTAEKRTMRISELFYSIQGESTFAGLPCAFIRLAGCNLRCSYCDTEYAFNDGKEMSVPEIMQAISAFPTKLALVTGGEPMLQLSVHDLFRCLLEQDYKVLVETGGHESLAEVDSRIHKVMDFKCPSSGMEAYNNYRNISYLTQNDEVKFVVGDRRDFDWACNIVRRYDLPPRVGAILFSPVHLKLCLPDLANWVLHCGFSARMQLQMHKIIWPNARRGV
jgi:7-carboxy-7-deazaguanine synthase